MWDLPGPGLEPMSPALAGGFFFFLFNFLIYYLFIIFIFGCVGSSFLCEGFLQLWRVGATLHRGARASHYRGLSLRSRGSRRSGSVVVAHGPSCSAACGIFPDQGSNPCPLHWQADSQPLRHQGSPAGGFLTTAPPGKSKRLFKVGNFPKIVRMKQGSEYFYCPFWAVCLRW